MVEVLLLALILLFLGLLRPVVVFAARVIGMIAVPVIILFLLSLYMATV